MASHFATVDCPIRLDRRRQLFIDRGFESREVGLRRTLHQPRRYPFNPVLSGAFPWEGDRVIPAAVMRDPGGRFQMWYTTTRTGRKQFANPTREDFDRAAGYLCYAESDDGLRWRRPELGVQEFAEPWQLPWNAPPGCDRSTANNILLRSRALEGVDQPELETSFLCRDDHDPDPAKRYKALLWQQGDRYKELDERGAIEAGKRLTGYCPAFSPDGLRWTFGQPVLVYPTFRDAGSVMHDTENHRFVGFFKTSLRDKRSRAICVSDALIRWSGPRVALEADARDPEHAQIYDNSGFVYESMYLGTMGLFLAGDEATIHQELIFSRDGLTWERLPTRERFFSNGRPGIDWDGGMVRALRPPVIVGEELWFYYHGFDKRHWQNARCAIGLATLRRDGFVSLDAADEGRIETPIISCAGGSLCINADASRGRIEAELSDAEGRPLPGFGRSECVPVTSDATRAAVTWRHGRPVPRDQPVRLKLHLRSASLYSVWCE